MRGAAQIMASENDYCANRLLVALERGDPWPDAIAIALGAAAANAENPGAGHLDQARARELATQARISELSG